VTPALYTAEADLDRLIDALAVITGTKAGSGSAVLAQRRSIVERSYPAHSVPSE
jgi:hypothetical protein